MSIIDYPFREERDQFPALRANPDILYADSASTSLTPDCVLDKVRDYHHHYPASVSRATYDWAERAGEAFEQSRRSIARLIGCSARQIVFCSGTTDAINLIANSVMHGRSPNAVVSVLEHHANILPWSQRGSVRLARLDPSKRLDLNHLETLVDADTKIIAISAASNVTGQKQPVDEIAAIAKSKQVPLLIDAAQAVGHYPIDVQTWGCDFLVASGHKMLAPGGTGFLYISDHMLDGITPSRYGGGMVHAVDLPDVTFKQGSARLEGGTPNVDGVIGLGKAADMIRNVGTNAISSYLDSLRTFFIDQLSETTSVLGPALKTAAHTSIVSVEPPGGISAQMLCDVLASNYNIFCRSGVHCCEPYFRINGLTECVRFSFHLYNTPDDASRIADALRETNGKFTGKRTYV